MNFPKPISKPLRTISCSSWYIFPFATLKLYQFSNFIALLLSFIFISCNPALSEEKNKIQTNPIIYAIEVSGNRVTSNELILRQMKLKPGMTATQKALENDRLNIASLGLFNRVEIILASDEGRSVVQVIVNEPFYIYPYIIASYELSNPDHTVLGLGVYHYNFRGQGLKLGIAGWGGYKRGLILFHEDTWFSINGKYGLAGKAYYLDSEITDPLGRNVRRENTGVRLSIKRRLGLRHYIKLGCEWEVITSESQFYTLTSGNMDRVVSFIIEHKNDQRDYRYYPTKGHYILINAEANRLVDIPHDFYRELIDVRCYRKFDPIIIAARAWGEFGQHTLPFYQWLSVGRSMVRAGEPFSNPNGIVLGGTMEFRFPIIRERYFSYEKVAIAAQYLRNLRFSLEGVIFGDRGFYANTRSGFRNDFRAYGCGFQVQLSYINIFHVLVGWTPSSKFMEPSITISNGVTF
ncbi:MAG: POTRA domain-containing protein [Candidatus Hatepunaea meridiana]|nr:POTRA domain-containing protein [Candidatus Hatepunaea meridiana]